VTDNPVRRFGLIPRDEGTRTTFDLSVDSVFVSHVVEIFCELRIDGVLGTSPKTRFPEVGPAPILQERRTQISR
jgi:hypothetical protein